MVEPEVVRQMQQLFALGWGSKRISQTLGIARNTVRRYRRGEFATKTQVRPKARRLGPEARAEAISLFESTAEGNAVVAQQLLSAKGVEASIRTVQRAVEDRRRELTAAALATVRYETVPGRQMQIDFGQKWVSIAGAKMRIYLLVAVLSHSRRLFVKAFLAERQDDWREGIAAAFRHFGGVPLELLGDNAKALVTEHNRVAQTVTFHPGYLAFCKDWDVVPRACGPYRARTKGKTESGVKYVKRNGLAGREFENFAALEAHLAEWMVLADQRLHGTTHEAPALRFERDEKHALRPLPSRPPVARDRRLVRKVANDALVDVDTVRYSVPHRLVKERVEVNVGESLVTVFHGQKEVARHTRSFEPHSKVVDPSHYEGLWRPAARTDTTPSGGKVLKEYGRSLTEYAAVVEGKAA
ncbi:MAG: IS21 family transposase [Myxococcota bacterium]|nr:IS21 family transposase [Myxococcota bacterium]